MEGVIRLQKRLTTLSQNETKLNAAYGPVVKQQTRADLTADNIELIDTETWITYKTPKRVEVNVNDMSDAGRVCRKRAILETERRFFGNNTENTFEEQGLQLEDIQGKVEMSDRELDVLLLDPRTCGDEEVMDKED